MEEELLSSENIRYNEIKNTIKIWPYLDDISQAIFPYTNRHLSKDHNMVVSVDFSNVKRINSSVAAITLKKLVSLIKPDTKKRPFKIVFPEDEFVKRHMQLSGFFSLIDSYFHFININGDLFNEQPVCINNETEIIVDECHGVKSTYYPIYQMKYNPDNVRDCVDNFEEWLDVNILEELNKKSKIKIEVLFSVLTEIAKNSQDHTESDAFWGFDVIEDVASGNGELVFSCSDLGKGISQKVREYLGEHPQEYLRADVWKHGSLTDFYKWAFTLGNTTSKKSHNKGIGMTMIIDGAQELNMDLSFFDARSMMQIPNSLHFADNAFNHEELRRRAWNTESKVGFYYYGKLKF